MYERDVDGLPTGRLIAPPRHRGTTASSCTQPVRSPSATSTSRCDSDADHLVVFDHLAIGTAVEPQSGPPDAFTSGARECWQPGDASRTRWRSPGTERDYRPVTPAPATGRHRCAVASGACRVGGRASTSPLRIAYLTYRGKPHVGGQGVYTRYLTKALVDLGHHVEVFSGQPYPILDPRVPLVDAAQPRHCSTTTSPVASLRTGRSRPRHDVLELAQFSTGTFPDRWRSAIGRCEH